MNGLPEDKYDGASFGDPEIDPGGLTDTVVRGVGLAGLGYVSAQALTLAFYLALARLATPKDFGQFAAGSMLVNIGLLFTESGMLAALIHREDRIDEAASTATVATALSGLGLRPARARRLAADRVDLPQLRGRRDRRRHLRPALRAGTADRPAGAAAARASPFCGG